MFGVLIASTAQCSPPLLVADASSSACAMQGLLHPGGDFEREGMRPMELLLGNAVKPLGRKSMGTVWMHHFGSELAAVKWITLDDDPPHTAGYTAKQKSPDTCSSLRFR